MRLFISSATTQIEAMAKARLHLLTLADSLDLDTLPRDAGALA